MIPLTDYKPDEDPYPDAKLDWRSGHGHTYFDRCQKGVS